MKRKFFLILVTLLAALALGGCRLNIGSISSHTPGHFSSRYAYRDGAERAVFHASQGQDFQVQYAVKVNRGALKLQVQDASRKSIWEQTFQSDRSGKTTFDLPSDGLYTVLVDARQTSGSFQLDWSVQ